MWARQPGDANEDGGLNGGLRACLQCCLGISLQIQLSDREDDTVKTGKGCRSSGGSELSHQPVCL